MATKPRPKTKVIVKHPAGRGLGRNTGGCKKGGPGRGRGGMRGGGVNRKG